MNRLFSLSLQKLTDLICTLNLPPLPFLHAVPTGLMAKINV